ncbi:hypothetical protein MNBD_PLANCTO03-1098 [hydrothermal vent metagenome]|uniref:Uncharacterized protein n=1 Tax=hydrothermal vent metagenome TaxID=652676 RepID=A0A3B1E967_9ZZZZ
MNRLCQATVPLLFLALVGSPAVAQPEPSFDLSAAEAAEVLDAMAPTNAALVYYQIFLQPTDPRLIGARYFYEGEEIDEQTIEYAGMTPEEGKQVLIDAQDSIEKYIWAASLPECDFGLQYQDGWVMLLPHIQKLRDICRTLSADAYRLAADGEYDKAADRLEAIYNIGQQIKDDRVLISSMVSLAMAAYANSGVQYMVEHDQLTEQGRDRFITKLEAIQTDDPFNLLDSMVMENTISLGWIARELAEGRSAEQLMELLQDADNPAMTFRMDDKDNRNASRSIEKATLLQDAERMSEYYKQVVAFWNDPDAVTKLEALGAIAEIGGFGEIGRVLTSATSRVKQSELVFATDLDDTLDALYAYRPTAGTDDAKADDSDTVSPSTPAATDPASQR